MPNRNKQPKPVSRWTFLKIIGVVQIAQGISWTDANGITINRERGFSWIPDWIPFGVETSGGLLIFTGLICLLAAYIKSAKLERIAFGVAMLPWTVMCLIFLMSSLLQVSTVGWISAISYGGMASLAYASAGIINSEDIYIPTKESDVP